MSESSSSRGAVRPRPDDPSAEVVRGPNGFYILSTSARIDDRTRVLKHGDTFAVFDRFGDIEKIGAGELGVYHQDTRFLSKRVLRLAGHRPLLLSSTVKDDNATLAVDLTNPDLVGEDDVEIPRGTLHLFRSTVLWSDTCYERLRVHNYGLRPAEFEISLQFEADFADIFEVRGARRPRRGRLHPAIVTADTIETAYDGLDNRTRRTRIVFDPAPPDLTEEHARFVFRLEPGAEREFQWSVSCEVADRPASPPAISPTVVTGYESALREASAERQRFRDAEPQIYTANEQFNDWLNRSLADLHMMRTDTPYGPYPYAGVPWFSTAFGRDGIITAIECLWYAPELARGVLAYLARTQATEADPERDAQPGKILHETRSGEMATLGEVPFGRYYGSVDATPLFVILAGAYHRRTADDTFLRTLWPHIQRALQWIEGYGDVDGDGFVEYARRSERGLLHQGWKDSQDAVFHADGSAADAPIALCEVQGYVYGAKREAARLARLLGHQSTADTLEAEADALRERFADAFWDAELGTYALALDGRKRLCRVRTSNAGHCLMSGIALDGHARGVAETLMQDASFSGWGIRTVAAGEARYNPMSYHNGSVWPHDNAIIAAGLARYGFKEQTLRLLTGLFDASLFFDLHRLPELFCGFPRRPGESPTLYPVSCAPQAWASGAALLMLQACLGLEIDATAKRVIFANPQLPPSIQEVEIQRLRVADTELDLTLTRHDHDVAINVTRKEGEVSVVAVK